MTSSTLRFWSYGLCVLLTTALGCSVSSEEETLTEDAAGVSEENLTQKTDPYRESDKFFRGVYTRPFQGETLAFEELRLLQNPQKNYMQTYSARVASCQGQICDGSSVEDGFTTEEGTWEVRVIKRVSPDRKFATGKVLPNSSSVFKLVLSPNRKNGQYVPSRVYKITVPEVQFPGGSDSSVRGADLTVRITESLSGRISDSSFGKEQYLARTSKY